MAAHRFFNDEETPIPRPITAGPEAGTMPVQGAVLGSLEGMESDGTVLEASADATTQAVVDMGLTRAVSFAHPASVRAQMLRDMEAARLAFYYSAARIGVHAFVEFAGLMGEYIKVCEKANAQGVDFTMASKHSDAKLPLLPSHIEYLNEKLECIYGVRIGTAKR